MPRNCPKLTMEKRQGKRIPAPKCLWGIAPSLNRRPVTGRKDMMTYGGNCSHGNSEGG